MKKLLVLGGISVIVDIVKKAKKDGYYVIVTDNLYDSPAKRIADEIWMLSIDDVEGIVKKCKLEHVDGVMNYCLDPGQKPYQQICEKLNLPCVASFEQFEIMTNKDKFVECCKKYGVNTIPEYIYPDEISNIEYPVIIKPVDSRASKGICLCNTKNEFEESIKYAYSFSKQKRIRIEKYLECPEICVKYFVADGHVFLTSMADVFTCKETDGRRVYLGTQTYPSKYYDEYLEKTNDKVINMIKGIKIKNGALSFTGFYDKGVFRFFDPSLRMGGAQDWMIVKAASGVDISSCLTNFAMTGSMGNIEEIMKIDKAFINRKSALLYFDLRPGRIALFEGIKEASIVSGVVCYHQNHYVGDTIESYGTANNVAIRFVISCNSFNEFKQTVLEIQSLIRIEDNNGNSLIVPMYKPDFF